MTEMNEGFDEVVTLPPVGMIVEIDNVKFVRIVTPYSFGTRLMVSYNDENLFKLNIEKLMESILPLKYYNDSIDIIDVIMDSQIVKDEYLEVVTSSLKKYLKMYGVIK